MSITHDTSPATRADVAGVIGFVADVRARLADLPAEDRDELLDGLEADLAEQLADGGPAVLDDPAAYAAELRAAAGLPVGPRRRVRVGDPTVWLEAARARWAALTLGSAATREVWSFTVTLRPAWWVLRAWVAVTALDQFTAGWERVTIVPGLGFGGVAGPVLLVVAVVLSVLIGRGRLWPGSGPDRALVSRVVLLGLNALVLLLPLTFSYGTYDDGSYAIGYADAERASPTDGVIVDGRRIRNLYAYDALGQPLTGVQLFDGSGEPVALAATQAHAGAGDRRVVGCPWFNGAQALFNVFPLQERSSRAQSCLASVEDGTDTAPIELPAPPLAQVPPVSPTAP